MQWIKSFLNEPGTSEGSSHRLGLLLILVFILAWLSYLIILHHKLPEVPPSLETLLEWLGGMCVMGIGWGKWVKRDDNGTGETNQ